MRHCIELCCLDRPYCKLCCNRCRLFRKDTLGFEHCSRERTFSIRLFVELQNVAVFATRPQFCSRVFVSAINFYWALRPTNCLSRVSLPRSSAVIVFCHLWRVRSSDWCCSSVRKRSAGRHAFPLSCQRELLGQIWRWLLYWALRLQYRCNVFTDRFCGKWRWHSCHFRRLRLPHGHCACGWRV